MTPAFPKIGFDFLLFCFFQKVIRKRERERERERERIRERERERERERDLIPLSINKHQNITHDENVYF